MTGSWGYPKIPPMPDLITTTEAAVILGVTAETVRSWCDQRKLRHVRLPSGQIRIDRADVLAALDPVEPTEAAS